VGLSIAIYRTSREGVRKHQFHLLYLVDQHGDLYEWSNPMTNLIFVHSDDQHNLGMLQFLTATKLPQIRQLLGYVRLKLLAKNNRFTVL
jgi:hypothetical protein